MNKYRAWDGEKMVVDGDRWYPRGESRHGRIPYEVQISSIGIHYTKLFDLGQKSVNIDGVDYYSNQDGDGDAVHSEGLELMQYIGINDMNGVGICEGDIASHAKESNMTSRCTMIGCDEIVWCNIYCRFKLSGAASGMGLVYKSYEILGNIYENPELLSAATANE
jgi:hypothetical protein